MKRRDIDVFPPLHLMIARNAQPGVLHWLIHHASPEQRTTFSGVLMSLCAPLAPATSAPGPVHICAGTGATSAPGPGPHLRQDPATSAPGPEPHLRRDPATSAPGPGHICAWNRRRYKASKMGEKLKAKAHHSNKMAEKTEVKLRQMLGQEQQGHLTSIMSLVSAAATPARVSSRPCLFPLAPVSTCARSHLRLLLLLRRAPPPRARRPRVSSRRRCRRRRQGHSSRRYPPRARLHPARTRTAPLA